MESISESPIFIPTIVDMENSECERLFQKAKAMFRKNSELTIQQIKEELKVDYFEAKILYNTLRNEIVNKRIQDIKNSANNLF